MVAMGLDNIVHHDREHHHARISNSWFKDLGSYILRKWYQDNEQRLLQKYKNLGFLDDEENKTYTIAPDFFV